MNIFHKVALQGLKKNRTRTLVTIIGVVLSAAMITGVATFGVSLLNYLTQGAIVKYGNWHVAFSDVDAAFIEEQTKDADVADTASVKNIGYAELTGSKNPDKPYLFVAGFDDKDFKMLPITLISGRLPENDGEILVSGSVQANGGVQFSLGDTLSLEVGERMCGNKKLNQSNPYCYEEETLLPHVRKIYTVVGIYQRPSFEQYTAPGYTLITRVDGADRGDVFSLFVTLKNPHDIHTYVKNQAGKHAYFFNDSVLRFMGLSEDNLFNGLLYSVGAVVIAIIMVGSVFLIYNSFYISLNERTRQFGILQSVGATAKQLRGSVLFEGLMIGVVGIPVGVLVGIGCMEFVILAVAKNFGNIMYNDVALTLVVSIPAILAAAAVSLITILISAYIPAKKAAAMPVMECIRQTNEVKLAGKARKTSRVTQRIYGIAGTLAQKNFERNKRRYRSIVLSLVLSVVLFISANAFITYFKQASERATVFTTYDIGLATPDMAEGEMLSLFDRLKTAEGIYTSSYQISKTYSATVDSSALSQDYRAAAGNVPSDGTVALPVSVQFLDDETYLNILESLSLPAEEYTGENAKLIAVAKIEDNSSRMKEVKDFKDMFTNSCGNVILAPQKSDGTVSEKGQETCVTFVDTVMPDSLPSFERTSQEADTFTVLAPYSMQDKWDAKDAHTVSRGLTFQSKDAAQSTAEMKKMLEGAQITETYTLYNMHEMLDESRNYIFIANVFAYSFIIMISMIAVANVFNTISTNIKLRRRELAMLRSVGMSERDFGRMMNFECIFFGGRALLIGLPLSVIFSWIIYRAMFTGGADNIEFTLPWASMGISIFSVLFIVFVTMLYATARIKKENIIDALRDDME